MKRRNIVIVDDEENLAIKVADGIRQFYFDKNEWNYDIILCNEEGHFKKAEKHIKDSVAEIDILICDQKLIGGQGIELFKLAEIEVPTELKSINTKPFLFRVLQSNQYERFFEFQDEHKKFYDRFINSDNPDNLFELLTVFETRVLAIKENGNPKINAHYYESGIIHKLRDLIKIDGRDVRISEILFLWLDNDNNKRDTYHFTYLQDEKVMQTTRSIKPTSISETITKLEFLEVQLKEDSQTLCKINPLWISSVVLEKKTVKIFTPYSNQYIIRCSKIKTHLDIDMNIEF